MIFFKCIFLAVVAVLAFPPPVFSQTVALDTSEKGLRQAIDGFGTCINDKGIEEWYQKLYFDELDCSIVRIYLTPRFKSPWSDHTYNSPWFHGDPSMPGPDGTNVRTYTGPADYTREFAGRKSPIAVMGPDIDDNIKRYFDLDSGRLAGSGTIAKMIVSKSGDRKIFGSVWSPAPWLKLSSGNKISGQKDPMPKNGTPWPFIWFDNFSGGILDTSGELRNEFDDSALPGGEGPTSALTQYARGFASWVRAYQNKFGFKFDVISLQNEPHLEVFYDSCLYRTSEEFIKALRAAREEFDKYPDLKDIQLIGPEDTIGSESTYLWFWENNGIKQHKLLQFMKDIEADPAASKALAFYCVHGYAADGITSAGAEPKVWEWAARGWEDSPDPQVPSNIKGYESYGKKCWMTETSGENPEWLYPAAGFPSKGAFSIAIKIHQALTMGNATAWIYWQLTDQFKPDDQYSNQALTNRKSGAAAPKLVAFKHFSKHVRPGARRVDAAVDGTKKLKASAYLNEKDRTLVWVIINASKEKMQVKLAQPKNPVLESKAEVFTSCADELWKGSVLEFKDGAGIMEIPAFGVSTVIAKLEK